MKSTIIAAIVGIILVPAAIVGGAYGVHRATGVRHVSTYTTDAVHETNDLIRQQIELQKEQNVYLKAIAERQK